MTNRKKKRPQEGGGFLKKVSSLFNLDTVIIFIYLFNFTYICCIYYDFIIYFV